MSAASKKQLLVGLRGSGKSTYLAALWHQVESGEISTSLRVPALQPDREYLNGLRRKWLSFEPLERTTTATEQTVTIALEREDGSERVDVVFPDLSGELYKVQWTERRATQPYADHVRSAGGVMLFVHPLTVVVPARIEGGAAARATVDAPEPASPWDAEKAPTQVQLVEVLQFIRVLHPAVRMLPTVVIISAWDTVPGEMRPPDWLAQGLPLLDQFLAANHDDFSVNAYGISAIGGRLPEDRERLQRINPPSRRPYLVDDEGQRHEDLSIPVRWLLEKI